MTTFLNWINNNFQKGTTASIVMTIVAYSAAKGYIGAEEVTMIGALSTILFGASSYTWQITKLQAINANNNTQI